MIRIHLFIIILLVSHLNLSAQDDLYNNIDSLPKIASDSIKIEKKRGLKNFLKKDYPSPKKAILLAIVPGMGQIYNKKYWKLPLVYGALGGIIFAIKHNTTQYNRTVLSLDIRNGVITGVQDPFEGLNIPDNAVEAERNSFDKNRQVSWISLIGFYLISAGDAFVDAHLKDFNVDDDISFHPIFETGFMNQPVVGIGVQIPLGLGAKRK